MKSPLRWTVLSLTLIAVLAGATTLVVRGRNRLPAAPAPDGPVTSLVLDLGKGVGLELVRVNPGDFVMGSPASETGHDPSESPQRKVHVGRAIFMGKFEVTQGQYQAVMGLNQGTFKEDPRRAIDNISWTDGVKFCKYVSERTGRTVRLPTEAEWEYACRAGSDTAFAFGDTLRAQDAVFNWSKVDAAAGKPDRPAVVDTTRPNAWGLYGMHGNVWEWCQDAFADGYAAHSGTQAAVPAANPQSAEVDYVYRGGSWRSGPAECRSAVRFAGSGELRSDVMGFRVVVEVR